MSKRIFLPLVCVFLLIIQVFGKDNITATEIVDKMNKVVNPETTKAKVKMIIITSSGQEREFVYDSYSKNGGEKNLIRYLKPGRTKDQAILILNYADDIWTYNPRTRRVRKLATHAKRQKLQGSDFAYEDMGAADSFVNDYTSKKLGEEKKEGYDCYKIELRRKENSDAGYSRLIVWVIKENFLPVSVDYYKRKDEEFLEKTLVQYNIKEVDGIPTGMKMIMYSKVKNIRTRMEFLEVEFNIKLEDEMFTVRSLRK
jgi:outer membrane lipoprotein-sorting protein